MAEPSISLQLQVLQAQYPGVMLLTIEQAAAALNAAPSSVRTDICRKKFPVKTVKRGKFRLIPVTALAEYLDALVAGATEPPRRRGRPRKSAAATPKSQN